jgi:hypothetical protein
LAKAVLKIEEKSSDVSMDFIHLAKNNLKLLDFDAFAIDNNQA